MNKQTYFTELTAQISGLPDDAAKFNKLSAIFQDYTSKNNLPFVSASEIVETPNVTEDQNNYLYAFIEVWEGIE